MKNKIEPKPPRALALTLGILAGVLSILFWKSYAPSLVLFSNDGPLGASSCAAYQAPGIFSGIWQDLNWLGISGGSASPNLTNLFLWLLRPVGFAKFYCPLSLFTLGLCTWFFLRQLGFAPSVGLLGALAAMLNGDFFSYSCWGLGTLSLCVAGVFLALGFVALSRRVSAYVCFPLAGLALGWAIMEGYDNGAIFSVYLAAFVMYDAFVRDPNWKAALGKGVARVACVAVFAAFMSAQALSTLIGTQLQGIAGTQPSQPREERWTWATQWSLPKAETIRLIIPGLYGYRMDTPDGGSYRGGVGRDPALDAKVRAVERGEPATAPLMGTLRYSGAGFYAGVFVVLVAAWAAAQLFRKKDNPFTPLERCYIAFWLVTAFVSLLFAFGRHAPFYHFIFALPYFSTIRNPIKFLHPLSVSLVILFAYGLQGLVTRYVQGPAPKLTPGVNRLKHWWTTAAAPFDRRFSGLMLMGLGIALLAWLLYVSSRRSLEAYLKQIGFGPLYNYPPEFARQMAGFSIGEMGLFVLFLALSAALVLLSLSGTFTGRRGRWWLVAAGLLLVGDLARANLPWIVHYNYREKYATNQVLDLLRDRPYERRVILPQLPFGQLPPAIEQHLHNLQQIYGIEWLQHHFQYYNIQSLDVIQMPREPVDFAAFRGSNGAFAPGRVARQPRLWELTNTRFLLSLAPFVEALNQQLDPQLNRFRVHTLFEFYRDKAGGPILARTNTTGPFAIVEFSGALPRAGLYASWEVVTNDATALELLAGAAFNPAATVLVADAIPASPGAATNAPPVPGPVEYVRYAPKTLTLNAAPTQPSVLLLNDKFDPSWRVTVDGQAKPLLRCNYLMRGVYLEPGKHVVEFRFQPPVGSLYVTLAAIALGLVLSGIAIRNVKGRISKAES